MSRTPSPLYREIVSTLNAMENCRKNGNNDWLEKHEITLEYFEKLLPSGGGFDNGTKIIREKSSAKGLVLETAFHHMDENGFYDGWTEHPITIRPCLQFGIEIVVHGRNKKRIKDYIHEQFDYVLNSLVWQDESAKWHSSMFEKSK